MAELTIGALAKRTGLTVRALHHYDEIGLLTPSGRTDGGYRLYSDADITRLEHVVLLRSLGIPLDGIAAAIDSDANTILCLLDRQAREIESQIEQATHLRVRLGETISQLRAHEYRNADDALALIEAVAAYARYFTDEQREALRRRAEALGPERIRQAEGQWARLIADVRREMEAGTLPSHPRVMALAEEWQSLLEEFTNGRSDIALTAGRIISSEPFAQRRMTHIGLNAEVMDYVAQAMAFL